MARWAESRSVDKGTRRRLGVFDIKLSSRKLSLTRTYIHKRNGIYFIIFNPNLSVSSADYFAFECDSIHVEESIGKSTNLQDGIAK